MFNNINLFYFLDNDRIKEPQPTLMFNFERPILEEQDVRLLYQYEKPKKSGNKKKN